MPKDLVLEFLGFIQADLSNAEKISLEVTALLTGKHEDEAVLALVMCTVVALKNMSAPEKIATLAGLLEQRAAEIRAQYAIAYGHA